MAAEATVLWAQARERHIPSHAKSQEPCLGALTSRGAAGLPGSSPPGSLGRWAIGQGKAFHCGTRKALFICSFNGYLPHARPEDEGWARESLADLAWGPILLAVIFTEARGSERTEQRGQASPFWHTSAK